MIFAFAANKLPVFNFRFFQRTKIIATPTRYLRHIKPPNIWGLYPLNILDYNPHNKYCQGGDLK